MAFRIQFQIWFWPALATQPVSVDLEILKCLQCSLYNLVSYLYILVSCYFGSVKSLE